MSDRSRQAAAAGVPCPRWRGNVETDNFHSRGGVRIVDPPNIVESLVW